MWYYVSHIRRCAHTSWALHLISSCSVLCRQGRAFSGTAPKADMEQLSKALNEVVDQLRPTQEEQERQKAAFEQVRSTLLHQWPEAKVHLFGSTANCLSICNNNDIDVCLELPEGIEDQVSKCSRSCWHAVLCFELPKPCCRSSLAPFLMLHLYACSAINTTAHVLAGRQLFTVINHDVVQHS